MKTACGSFLKELVGLRLIAAAILPACVALTQTAAPVQSPPPKPPPAFSAAGVQGSTAPSGYSTGISREENTAVNRSLHTLAQELLSGFVVNWPQQDCSLEPELIKASETSPESYEATRKMGLFYLEHGEFTRSVNFLQAAYRLRPADRETLSGLALALLGADRSGDAFNLLKSALANAGQDAALLRLLALAYHREGDDSRARETYQRAVAASPGDAGNLLGAGLGLIVSGAPLSAAEIFGAGSIAQPKDARLFLGLGIAQEMTGRKPDAVRSLLHAIAIDPSLAPAYFFLASLADASPESASDIRTRLAEFVAAHPSSAEAHYDYALALWLQGREKLMAASDAEVQSQLRLALTTNPEMARAHYLLGLMLSDVSDFAGAEAELIETVRLEPGNPEAHYHLAQAYKRDGKTKLATAEMRKFQDLHAAPGGTEEPLAEGAQHSRRRPYR